MSAILAAALLAMPSMAQAHPPAGEMLYSRLTDDAWQIWLRELSTGQDTQVTSSLGDKRYPGWKPSGEVYYHTITQGCFVIPSGADGDDDHVPVLLELWPVRDLAWSPDGKRIAFSRIRTDLIDAANLCVFGEGKGASWLTQEAGIQYNPSWSPDGTRIVFVSGNGWGTYEIETIGADGGDRRRLTENGQHEFLPAWSPDGRSIAFVSDRSGNYEIWSMASDGASPRRLTDHPGLDTGPVWSPDGRTVAYTSARGGSVQIWSSPAEGGEARLLVEAPGGARDPAWRATPLPAPEATAVEAGAPASLLLSEIGVFPKTLRLDSSVEVELRFRLSQAAGMRVDLVDETGRVCRRLEAPGLAAGAHALHWDGTDERGEPVPDGVYRYVLVVDDGKGHRAVQDPSTEPWGEMMQPTEFTFDETTGRMRWIQPRAGFARLRTAVQDFPLLGTLLDWEPLEGGEQIFDWDGRDASGTIQLGTHPARWITLELISMPRNTILVAGGADPRAAAVAPDVEATYPPLVATGDQAHLEVRKPRREALAPRLSLELPSAEGLDAEGRPIVRGNVPVRVTIAPEDAPSMTNALFEVAFYIDLTFFFEDEESTTPMTWMWDTSELAPGPHILTVNVFSYDGRIGCITRPVVVGSVQ